MRLLIALIATLALAGCGAPLYKPIVDKPSADYSKDLAECRTHAQEQLGAPGSAAAGAAVGFGLGYLLCRSMGGRDCSRTGRGGAVAGAAGGAAGGVNAEREVVRNCLRSRGHAVLN